ncbi:MAG: phenylalanine--tRNA ligase subunit beta [Legionellales bacterium]|nr:phenylalanine--tRNA ligase subunit beta [Legionellales bacterium]
MKISEQWLREWVNPAITTQEISQQLTLAGLEVDEVINIGHDFSQVVIGQVETISPHPDADKLRVCEVNIGEVENLQIVCGAHNFSAGVKVPVALIGAVLPGNFKIKLSKLRGVPSQGMICSPKELNLGEDIGGIWVLPEDAPIGKSLQDYLHLPDHIIEVDLTPNRGDCLSIQGIAREIAAKNGVSLLKNNSPIVKPTLDEKLEVRLSAPTACSRYAGRMIRDINPNATTPLWMVERLRRSGLRSIHPVVDVTNYVMLELGQPLHAFDFAKIQQHIEVRLAQPQEKIVLLDGKEITLLPNDLVIADAEKALALAGIMGGVDSSVSAETTTLFLESAFFNPTFMMGKARQHGLHSDSSHRFERGVDPNLTVAALERATELLLAIVGGQVGPISEVIVEHHLPKNPAILLKTPHISRLLGMEFSAEDIKNYLQRLNFSLSQRDAETWEVCAPSYRFDITIEEDVIEEIARIHGYDAIPPLAPQAGLTFQPQPEAKLTAEIFSDSLIQRGYQEIITYSFVDEKIERALNPDITPLRLRNPIASDMNVMRTSLLPGLLTTVAYNQNRQQEQGCFFEIGLRYLLEGETIVQQPMLAGACYGFARTGGWHTPVRVTDFYDIKADVEALLILTRTPFEFAASTHSSFHPGQCALIRKNHEIIGHVGALHPKLMAHFNLKSPLFLFELSLNALLDAQVPVYKNISKFPSIRRDLAILVNEDVPAAAICAKIQLTAGAWLQEIKLFDLYRGEGVSKGLKSLAIGIVLQHPTRTLVDEEINQTMEQVILGLQQEWGATLRT